MTIPVPFLLGLVVLLIHEELGGTLPGIGSLTRLAPWLVLLPVPWLLARSTAGSLGRVMVMGQRGPVRLRFHLQLQSYAVPFVYYLVMTKGDLPSVVTSLSLHSILAETLLLLAPLLLMESTLRFAERSVQTAISNTPLEPAMTLGIGRLRMALFVTAPILLFAGVTDLAFLDRRAEVFLSGTSLGTTLGLGLMVLFLCAVMPLMFRLLLSTTSKLPVHLAA